MSNFYGLIGEKLGHSISPEIHELILRKINIEGVYNLFEIKAEDLKTAVKGLKALGAKGVNVTIPYKIQVMDFLDTVSREAEKIGAVNTISFKSGTLSGHNTDYHGFGATLKKAQVDICDKKAVILGTGGASRAVIHYLMDNGIKELIFVSRNPEETLKNIKDFKVISYNDLDKLNDGDIIINCTPCGMYPKADNSPVSKGVLSKFSSAVDLIYNPEETLFLKEAKGLGLKTVNGLYMLVAQAVAAQEIWQGIKICDESIEEIYEEIRDRFAK